MRLFRSVRTNRTSVSLPSVQTSSQVLPGELLSLVLQECMYEYFSMPQHPLGRPPPVLQVCRLWRQSVLEDPQCWTKISILLDTSLFPNTITKKSSKALKKKVTAFLTNLKAYFARSKGHPVDITLGISLAPEAVHSGRVGHYFHPSRLEWLSYILPNMRSFSESFSSAQTPLFAPMTPCIKPEKYECMTSLETTLIYNGDEFTRLPSLILPQLRVLNLRFSQADWVLSTSGIDSLIKILGHFVIPSLRKLFIDAGIHPEFASIVAFLDYLAIYPLLEEVLTRWSSWGFSAVITPNSSIEGQHPSSRIRYLFLVMPNEHEEPTSFLCHLNPVFLGVTDVQMETHHKSISTSTVLEEPGLAPWSNITHLTLRSGLHFRGNANSFFQLFPNVEILTLGYSGSLEEEQTAQCFSSQFCRSIPEYALNAMLHTLTQTSDESDIDVEPPDPSFGSPRYAPSLKHLIVIEVTLTFIYTFGFMARCLSSRQPTSFRISLENCRFQAFGQDDCGQHGRNLNGDYLDLSALTELAKPFGGIPRSPLPAGSWED